MNDSATKLSWETFKFEQGSHKLIFEPIELEYAHHNECQTFINAAQTRRINVPVILA
jgi:hypothetical protein